ncbi:hypothetical protein TorRG33x02_227960 [Trema orientale]|uniref:Retrotransposon gag domain-containing protein n=1 Tax=Trema orientale TaxID=63057 RepID=A0A2P5E7D7_TREOI|nr:hypothetical protein TorRG33x02_227960 [Trema orientale]
MDREALTWFQWEDSHRPICSSAKLNSMLIERFRYSQGGTLCEKFLTLKQVGTVSTYRPEFEVLASSLHDVPEHILESTFINGLISQIRAQVRLMKSIGLFWVMEFAQRVEDRNLMLKQDMLRSESTCKGCLHMDYGPSVASTKHSEFKSKSNLAPNSNALVKRLTDSELQARKTKGSCFRCDGKYSAGHRCKNKALQVLMVHDDTNDALLQDVCVRDKGETSEHGTILGCPP